MAKMICPKWRECQHKPWRRECGHVTPHELIYGCGVILQVGVNSLNPRGCPMCKEINGNEEEDMLLGATNE
jgi:hypothetical protein